ncbi:hypothetical protein KJ836_02825 [Patescibacteria group bacterium]|nr:hypothetical protein [Patescibacteria group bacterium]
MTLTRKEVTATIYALRFTLLADRGTMTEGMIDNMETALDKLLIQSKK